MLIQHSIFEKFSVKDEISTMNSSEKNSDIKMLKTATGFGSDVNDIYPRGSRYTGYKILFNFEI